MASLAIPKLANKRAASSDSGQQSAQKRHAAGQAENAAVADSNATSVNKKGQMHKVIESLTQLTLTLEREVALTKRMLQKCMTAETKEAGTIDPATPTLEDYEETSMWTMNQMPKEAMEDHYSPPVFSWLSSIPAVLRAIENHYQDVKQILEVVLDQQKLLQHNLHALSHMKKDCSVDWCHTQEIKAATSSSVEQVAVAISAFLHKHAKGKYKANTQPKGKLARTLEKWLQYTKKAGALVQVD